MYENHFNNNFEFDIEYRIQKKDGTWIWLHDKAMEQIKGKKERFSYDVFMDVTKQKKVEQELKEKEEQISQFFHETPVPLLEFDFSEVKIRIDHLKKFLKGKNVNSYLKKHPEEFLELIRQVRFVQGNYYFSEKLGKEINQTEGKKRLREVMERNGYKVVKLMVIALLEGKRTLDASVEE